jgi:hypothetical protein
MRALKQGGSPVASLAIIHRVADKSCSWKLRGIKSANPLDNTPHLVAVEGAKRGGPDGSHRRQDLKQIRYGTGNLPLALVLPHKHPRKPTAMKGDVSYTLCTAEVCYATGKLSDRFRADTDSSTRCPYRHLCAAILGSGSRPWVGNFLGHLGPQVANLLGPLGSYILGAYLVPDNPLVRPANSSMGLRPAKTTSSASFHTTLGDRTSIVGSVVG